MYSSLLLGVVVVIAAPTIKEPKAKEPPSIVGEWNGVSATSGGKVKPVPEGGIRFTFTKDGNLSINESGRTSPGPLSYKINAKKTPAEIELGPPKGDDKMLGIFKIEGDTLMICLVEGKDAARPKKFDSPPGEHSILMTLKHKKK